MRLTTRTNLAMRTLMFCAVNSDRTVRKAEVAAACNVSENHLAQVIHRLAQLGFLHTIRGRTGGFRLGLPASQIMIGTVVRATEASVPFIECMAGGNNTCPLTSACRLKFGLAHAVEAFYSVLDLMSLADLVDDNQDLSKLLSIT